MYDLEIFKIKMFRQFRQSTRKHDVGRNVPKDCSCSRYVSKQRQKRNGHFWIL